MLQRRGAMDDELSSARLPPFEIRENTRTAGTRPAAIAAGHADSALAPNGEQAVVLLKYIQ
jgi:hypothetical protein